jgi:diaminopimelate epimerase
MQLVTGAGTFQTHCLGEGTQAELHLPSFPSPAENLSLSRAPGERAVYLACVGVPHLVVLVADLEGVPVAQRGRELRSHPALGDGGANVNFVGPAVTAGPDGTAWPMRTYERGVEGETLACGTGAVAVAATLIERGLARSPVSILARSGKLLGVRAVVGETRVEDVWLAGEGRLVYRGVA